MKYVIKTTLIICLAFGCGHPSNNVDKAASNTLDQPVSANNDTLPGVTGIGGIFFYADDPKVLTEWYGQHLGLATDDFGSPFEFRNANRPAEINYLRWSPHAQGSDYFSPSNKTFMINYRVRNMEGLVRQLRQNGVTIVDTIASYPYGKFVHIIDPEGTKIELWEPIDSVLTKIGAKTTK